MEYKYITGKVLEITGSGWPDGTVLQEIYPDTSFVSGIENPKGMKMVPIIKDRKIYVQSGAGIVADSNPNNEYNETVNKAKALLKAIS